MASVTTVPIGNPNLTLENASLIFSPVRALFSSKSSTQCSRKH